jgi:hypothetical protein
VEEAAMAVGVVTAAGAAVLIEEEHGSSFVRASLKG